MYYRILFFMHLLFRNFIARYIHITKPLMLNQTFAGSVSYIWWWNVDSVCYVWTLIYWASVLYPCISFPKIQAAEFSMYQNQYCWRREQLRHNFSNANWLEIQRKMNSSAPRESKIDYIQQRAWFLARVQQITTPAESISMSRKREKPQPPQPPMLFPTLSFRRIMIVCFAAPLAFNEVCKSSITPSLGVFQRGVLRTEKSFPFH